MPPGLERFNSAPSDLAESALFRCCGSHRWARRIAAHRPYPDLDALLAAADEALYDLPRDELGEALHAESVIAGPLPQSGYSAADTALDAAHAAYEGRFGHAFVICLDDATPGEALDRMLAGIRSRLGNDPEDERALAADELRRVAHGRISRLVREVGPFPESRDSGCPDSPYVPV